MGWMKYVSHLERNKNTTLPQLKGVVKKAKAQNLNYVIYQGEVLSLEQVIGIIQVIEKNIKDDKVHSTSDPAVVSE